jgi:hypothetical protein
MSWSSLPASTTLILIVYNVSTTKIFDIASHHLLHLAWDYRHCMPALQPAAEDLRQATQHTRVEAPSAEVLTPHIHHQEAAAVVQTKEKRETTQAKEVQEGMAIAAQNHAQPHRQSLALNAQSGRKIGVRERYRMSARIYSIQGKLSCMYFTIRYLLPWEL